MKVSFLEPLLVLATMWCDKIELDGSYRERRVIVWVEVVSLKMIRVSGFLVFMRFRLVILRSGLH